MSDYLSDDEQLAKLKGWWESYGTMLIAGSVAALVVFGGWRWYQSSLEARTLLGSDLYAEYLQADADRRAELAETIIDDAGGTAYPAFVLLGQAEAAVAAGKAADAEPLLRRAIDAASGDSLADTARLRLARVLFELDREDEALATLAQVRSSGFRIQAAELKGDIHLARGERALAHESYVAAKSYVQAGDQRPVLEMKIADTADASGS